MNRAHSKRKKTQAIIWLIVIVLIAIALEVFVGTGAREDQRPEVETGETTEVAAGVTVTEKVLTESGSGYEVSATYPQFAGDIPGITAANRTIIETVEESVSQFTLAAQESPLRTEIPSSLNMTYETATGSDTFSVILTVSEYVSGAAHPNSYARTLVFSKEDGAQLQIDDLISISLSELSAIARTELEDRFSEVEQWWDEGLAPREENFSQFYIENETFILVFTPYQVAPYAEGIVYVSIPYEDLR